MYWRPYIREGDSLTASGGLVKPRPQQSPSTYHGKLACYEGDPVFCNTCQSWGVTKCVPPYRPDTDPEGRQANLDGDLCLCKCPTPPRLKASFDNVRMGFEEHEFARMPGSEGWLRYAGFSTSHKYDEQVQFTSAVPAISGIPFCIEYEDGRRVNGNLENNGLIPRIETDTPSSYHVYWGDEALQRIQGGEA